MRYSIPKFKPIILIVIFFAVFVGGCAQTTGSDERSIASFGFEASLNDTLSENVAAVVSGTGITASVPEGTDVTALIASFEGVGADIAVGGEAQTSGVTANDFTDPVTYNVTAGDGATTDYAVVVTIESGGGEASDIIKYVDGAGGSDATGDGSQTSPYATISKGIESVAESGGEVRVAKGVYRVSESIALVDGVSMYGGYDATDWSRDVEGSATTIMDTRTSSGVVVEPIGAISGIGEIGVGTVVDGFTIFAALGADLDVDVFSAISLRDGASPTISNNVINGGAGYRSYGVYAARGNPTISDNEINGCAPSGSVRISTGVALIITSENVVDNVIEACDRGDSSFGVTAFMSTGFIMRNTIGGGGGYDTSMAIEMRGGSNTSINNNVIDGGDSVELSAGVAVTDSAPVISNNTIFGGGSVGGIYAIRLRGEGYTVVSNNILFATAASGYGIHEFDQWTNAPRILQNNNIFDCGTALYHRVIAGESVNYDDIDVMQAALDVLPNTDASGNVDQGLTLDSEFRITTAPDPINVTQGGFDLSEQIILPDVIQVPVLVDRDGNPRSVPYSMGAYQYDD